LNPFELLNCPSDTDLDDLDARTVKGLKDKLLKEIELEDGVVAWTPHSTNQRRSASEELRDDIKREYHWHVFRNPLLLDFLSRGGFEHFLVDEASSPIEIIELLDDKSPAFREWLSEPFAKQFDLVLSRAIDLKNPSLITCLLAGRRWVAPSFTDACFQSSLRQIDRLLQPLRDAGGRAAEINLSVASVKALLDENSLLHLLNSLPAISANIRIKPPKSSATSPKLPSPSTLTSTSPRRSFRFPTTFEKSLPMSGDISRKILSRSTRLFSGKGKPRRG
jgi:hypothetical protein